MPEIICFGSGPHICIGADLAREVAHSVLTHPPAQTKQSYLQSLSNFGSALLCDARFSIINCAADLTKRADVAIYSPPRELIAVVILMVTAQIH